VRIDLPLTLSPISDAPSPKRMMLEFSAPANLPEFRTREDCHAFVLLRAPRFSFSAQLW
jgi:hypothetical protein